MQRKYEELLVPVPVIERSRAWVWGRSLVGITGSNSAGGTDVCLWCCQVEFPASGRSLVQRSRTQCGASVCVREASLTRLPWRTRGCCAMGKRDRGRIEIRVCARAPVLHACVYAIQTSDSQRNDKKRSEIFIYSYYINLLATDFSSNFSTPCI